MELKERIALARKQAGLSQEQLGKSWASPNRR